MRRRIALILVGTCIIAGMIVGCGKENKVAATETPGMERIANLEDGTRMITTYIDSAHSKIIYVVQDKGYRQGISITAVDLK